MSKGWGLGNFSISYIKMSCLFLKQEFLWMAHTEVRARYDELFHLCSEFFFYILKKIIFNYSFICLAWCMTNILEILTLFPSMNPLSYPSSHSPSSPHRSSGRIEYIAFCNNSISTSINSMFVFPGRLAIQRQSMHSDRYRCDAFRCSYPGAQVKR